MVLMVLMAKTNGFNGKNLMVKTVLIIDCTKFFKDLLTNKILPKQILSWNFKMEFCLNRGLVWKFLGCNQ